MTLNLWGLFSYIHHCKNTTELVTSVEDHSHGSHSDVVAVHVPLHVEMWGVWCIVKVAIPEVLCTLSIIADKLTSL